MSGREELLDELRHQHGEWWPVVVLRTLGAGMGVVYTAIAVLAWWARDVRAGSSWPSPGARPATTR